MGVFGEIAANSTTRPLQPMMKVDEGPDLQIILLMIILSVFAIVGSIGNGMVIFVFQRVRDKSTVQLFILFLALIDLLTCMIIIPLTAYVEFTEYKMKSDLLCKTYHFLVTTKTPLSLFIMVAIAVERYMCICRPLQRIITRTKAKVIIGVLSILSFTVGAFSLFFNSVYHGFDMIDFRKIDQQAGTNFTESIFGIYREDILMALHKRNYSFPDCDSGLTGKIGVSAAKMKVECELQSLPQIRQVVNVELCDVSFIHLSKGIFYVYQRAYKCVFPLCLVIVIALYSLIYRFMCKRRARKLHQKLKLCSYVNGDGTYENTRLVSTPPGPEGQEGERCAGDVSALSVPSKCTNLNQNKTTAKPVLVPQLVCLSEGNEAANQQVLTKIDVQDKTNCSADIPEQISSKTQNASLGDQFGVNSESSSPDCVSNSDESYAPNLLTDAKHLHEKVLISPCSVHSGVLQDKCETVSSNHLSNEISHPLQNDFLLQPLPRHTNNNYRKDRSPVSENSISQEFVSDCKYNEKNCSKFDLLSDELSSRCDVDCSRRSSHCPGKQNYQWHKKRDSMRRYKGSPRESRSSSDKEHGSRRRSPLSLEAERLSKENLKANVRTALMLFTVTFVFVLAYSPGWMMAMRIIPHHKLVFYLYFSYNVANPFVYAFMNHVFKRFMCKVFTCKNAQQSRI